MTAEIAVLNRQGVALAADSAVTLQHPKNTKIYNTNKLFSLSKYHPVGVMFYGSAQFMDAPWELIVKDYRARLGESSFSHLQQYGDDFLNFIERNRSLFPKKQQEVHCRLASHLWLRRLKNRLMDEVKDRLKNNVTVSENDVRILFREIVAEDMAHLRKHERLPRFAGLSNAALHRQYRLVIRKAISDELQKLRGAVGASQIELGCVLSIVQDLYWSYDSGLVVAGFGSADLFPSLRCYQVESIIGGKLRAREHLERRCDIGIGEKSQRALVSAYAQGEMVSLFMNGIDDDYGRFIKAFVGHSMMSGYPEMLGKILDRHVTPDLRTKILKQIGDVGKKVVEAFDSGMTHYGRQIHSNPIVDIVDHLPKEELAAMAEALVNLTSFKRHVTRQAETVGGPIDVAVISRGDGFIWIKRKHYFTRDLNPQFLANYFRDDGGNQ